MHNNAFTIDLLYDMHSFPRGKKTPLISMNQDDSKIAEHKPNYPLVTSYVWRHDSWLASICDCGTICDHIMLRFVTRHDLWPKVLQFVTSVKQWF